MEKSGLAPVDIILNAYDRRTEDALLDLVATLPSDSGGKLLDKLENSVKNAEDIWGNLFDGAHMAIDEALRRQPRRRGPGSRLLPDDGDMDAEHPHSAGGRALRIQRMIMDVIDECSHGSLVASLHASSDTAGQRRLGELADPDVDHSWLWRLNKHRGQVLSETEFVESLRLRLGCAGPLEPIACQLCGADAIGSNGAHALCCAKAESTIGHYKVTKQVLVGVQQIDPGAETQVAGLIPGTDLRPADILTVAIGGGAVALDIGICSPDAQNAGNDCVVKMGERKINYYAPHAAALDRQNISYYPLI